MITLSNKNQTATINKGELVSYKVNGYEIIHQKGSPGWGHSDTEMYPIIGPTDKTGFRVQVPKGNALQDQHGLLRELAYETLMSDTQSVHLQKTYKAGTLVKNSKYPEKSTIPRLIWPYDFQFKKSFILHEDYLEISFGVSGEKDMPFMIGYHPAFKLRTENPVISTDTNTYSLDEIMAAGNRAVEIPETTSLSLKDEKEISIKTTGFGNFMLWSPVASMVCIEPITFYPYGVAQSSLHEGFMYLNKQEEIFTIQMGLKK